MERAIRLIARILLLIGGVLLTSSSFVTWSYGVDSKEPYSVWSELVRFPDDPLHWLWFSSTGISGLLIMLLSALHLLVRDYWARKLWLLTIGTAAISFVLNSFWAALTPAPPAPPSSDLFVGLRAGAFAAVLGPLTAIAAMLLHQLALRREGKPDF